MTTTSPRPPQTGASLRERPAGLDADRLAAWRAFLEIHARITDVLAQELKAAHDLPLTWYDVLVQLSEAPDGQLRMQELADAVLLSKSGLTRLVDRMEQEGYVERVACDDDRRGTYAQLTASGRATLERCAPAHISGVARHFGDLIDEDELAVVRDVLVRIADGLRAPEPPASTDAG